ncbi:hypothetical protein GVN16_10435 [Emticicia sp. CRIBPO]|uniref:RHS repeat-associated core domain-containing protein n=1 Tax=Emticicia sp. CRIBPO TaxID=2683258 RepID=UPI001411FD5B|nr:RHS repeat-associated core domain-containing protein [Emticicia sp. CRIBPO]NBA86180.1 hypothetical protein [Emticicia sp. CRIBPO]
MTTVISETHYYPFGKVMNGAWYKDPVLPKFRYLYNGKELNEEFGLNFYDYGARWYDAGMGSWWEVDPATAGNYPQSPYQYVLNNPIRYIDPFGLWEVTSTGYSTTDKEDIKRYMSYMSFENEALNNNPSTNQMADFVKGEMSGAGLGTLSNGGRLISEIKETGYPSRRGVEWYLDKESVDNAWHEVQGDLTPEALDPRTIGHNIFWKTYPGPSNPKKYNGKDDYSYLPTNPIEYPGMIHDLAYDRKEARGAASLLINTKVIKDDWAFVAQEISLSYDPRLDPISRFEAKVLGIGLGLAATPKTGFYYMFLGLKTMSRTIGKGASAIKN